MPSLDIVIVNWNAGALLRRCLEAIPAALDGSFELARVVLVDNASTDGSADGLERVPLPITVLRNAANRGFAAGCNQGAAGSTADALLFLNPDAYVGAGSLAAPLAYLAGHDDTGVVGIQLRDHDGHVARSCAREPTAGVIAARILGLDVLLPGRVPSLFLSEWDHASNRDVPHVIGAFYMIRRELFERLGGFDQRYFVYLEDLDLSVRVRGAGYRIHFLADVHVEHAGGGTSDAIRATRIAYSLHSRILYGFKHFTWPLATVLALGTLLVEPLPRLARAVARGSAAEVRDTCLGFFTLWRRLLRAQRHRAGGVEASTDAHAADVRHGLRWPLAGDIATVAIALAVAPAVGGLLSFRAAAGIVVVAALVALYGRGLRRFLPLPSGVAEVLVTTIVGYAAASVVELALAFVFRWPARAAVAANLACAVALMAACGRRTGGAVPRRATSPPRWTGVVVMLACAALASLWSRETIRSTGALATSGYFMAWQDYPLHAAEISYLREYRAFDRRSPYMTGIPQPFYHRGSYALPSVWSAIGDVPALATATAYWMPTGLLLAMLGTWLFGASLAGTSGGVAAVAAVYLTPDASSYWLRNTYLSFHWLMQMAAGSGYAIAPVVLAFALLARRDDRTRSAWLAGASLIAAAFAFRVHVGLLAAAAYSVLLVMTGWRRVTAKRVAWIGVATVATGALAMWLESVSLAPHFFTGRSHPVPFFISVHGQAKGLDSAYSTWIQGRSDVFKVALGFAMMLVAGCGASLAVVGVGAVAGRLRRLGAGVAHLPIALLLGSLSVILLVPTPAHGDVTDFGHRPFVLVALMFGALAGVIAVRWLPRQSRAPGLARWGVGILVLAGLTVPWREGARIQQRWVAEYATIPVDIDLQKASEYVRAHAAPDDTIQTASEDPRAFAVALAERPAYLSRVGTFTQLGGVSAAVAAERAARHATIVRPTSFAELQRFGASEGVSWYVADTPTTLAWPEDIRRRCVYCGERAYVLDLR